MSFRMDQGGSQSFGALASQPSARLYQAIGYNLQARSAFDRIAGNGFYPFDNNPVEDGTFPSFLVRIGCPPLPRLPANPLRLFSPCGPPAE